MDIDVNKIQNILETDLYNFICEDISTFLEANDMNNMFKSSVDSVEITNIYIGQLLKIYEVEPTIIMPNVVGDVVEILGGHLSTVVSLVGYIIDKENLQLPVYEIDVEVIIEFIISFRNGYLNQFEIIDSIIVEK